MAMAGSDSHGDGDVIVEEHEDYFPLSFKEYLLKEALQWSRCRLVNSVRVSSGWVFWSQRDHDIEPYLSLDNFADFDPNVCALPKVRDNIRDALQKLVSKDSFVPSSILGTHNNIGGADKAYDSIRTFCSWSNILRD